MTERAKWWYAFLPKRKSGGSKDSSHTIGPDFDPFAQRSEKQKEPTAAASKTPNDQPLPQQGAQNKCDLNEDTFDDSHLESLFNEQTSRRNFNISRSGRYKDKRRIRSTIPMQEKEKETPGREDIRLQRGGEGGDPRLHYKDA